MRDANRDTLHVFLIDHIIERTLHEHARAKENEKNGWRHNVPPKHDPKAVTGNQGHTDQKARQSVGGLGMFPKDHPQEKSLQRQMARGLSIFSSAPLNG